MPVPVAAADTPVPAADGKALPINPVATSPVAAGAAGAVAEPSRPLPWKKFGATA